LLVAMGNGVVLALRPTRLYTTWYMPYMIRLQLLWMKISSVRLPADVSEGEGVHQGAPQPSPWVEGCESEATESRPSPDP
jgi:hypothetical protein